MVSTPVSQYFMHVHPLPRKPTDFRGNIDKIYRELHRQARDKKEYRKLSEDEMSSIAIERKRVIENLAESVRQDLFETEMETPHLPISIFGKDFENVYEPAEDTFLLLDALEKDLTLLKKRRIQICLECGSGSGTIITALSQTLNDDVSNTTLMFATDINSEACKVTKKCASYHNQHGVQVIRTNLSDALVDRLESSVDLLVFNPPYVPTIDNELVKADSSNKIYLSWAGGEKGRQLIDTFLKVHVTSLLSKPNGVAYMVALDQNNIDELTNYLLTDHGIKGSIVMQRKAGIESLNIIKYEWTSMTD